MIVFDLICRKQHRFEGWFSSGEDFTAQKDRGLLACPVCGVAHVEKLPAGKIRKLSEPAALVPDDAARSAKVDQVDMARIVEYVLTHSEDVGRNFPEEARKIHYQEAPQRNIRGVATPTEAESLHDEGISVFTLPIPPGDRWN